MTSVENYSFELELTKSDHARMTIHTWFRTKGGLVRMMMMMTFAHLFCRWAAYGTDIPHSVVFEFLIWCVTFLVISLIFVVMAIALFAQLFVFADKRLYRPTIFEISPKCVYLKQGDTQSDIAWDYFVAVRSTRKHCFLYATRTQAYIFPRRYMSTDTDWDEFCAFCREQFQLAKAQADQ